jgi:methionyl-tRNA formyltransferase
MGLNFVKSLNPDVIVLASFNQKVSSALISSAVQVCLNIHPSSLPNFKGVDPVFAALYANEKKLGVTVHLVDDNFDTGDIIAQASIPRNEKWSVFYHQLQLFQQGGKLAASIIKQLPHSIEKKSENIGGNYDSWPTKTKIKSFNDRGRRLIKINEYTNALKSLLAS